MGDGGIQFSKLVLNESHHYVTTVLGVESNSHSDALDGTNISINRDRIILLPATHSLTIATIKINIDNSSYIISVNWKEL